MGIGKTPPRKEHDWFTKNPNDILWYSIKDLGNADMYIYNSSEYLTESAIEKFNIKIIPTDSLLISFKLTIGRIAITTQKSVTNEAIAHCIFNKNNSITKEYLYFYLKNFDFESLGNTSSIGKAINSKIIKKMSVIVPSTKILDKFNKIVKPLCNIIKNNQKEIQRLTKLRDTLLPKLMTGEIDVSKVEL